MATSDRPFLLAAVNVHVLRLSNFHKLLCFWVSNHSFHYSRPLKTLFRSLGSNLHHCSSVFYGFVVRALCFRQRGIDP